VGLHDAGGGRPLVQCIPVFAIEYCTPVCMRFAVADMLSCLCVCAPCRAYLCNIITIWVYQAVPLLSALGVQPVAFSPAFRYVSMNIHIC
jgi:hypothetical protein